MGMLLGYGMSDIREDPNGQSNRHLKFGLHEAFPILKKDVYFYTKFGYIRIAEEEDNV